MKIDRAKVNVRIAIFNRDRNGYKTSETHLECGAEAELGINESLEEVQDKLTERCLRNINKQAELLEE